MTKPKHLTLPELCSYFCAKWQIVPTTRFSEEDDGEGYYCVVENPAEDLEQLIKQWVENKDV